MQPTHCEFEKNSAQINTPVPNTMLEAAKTKASRRGISFTSYIRTLMELDIRR